MDLEVVLAFIAIYVVVPLIIIFSIVCIIKAVKRARKRKSEREFERLIAEELATEKREKERKERETREKEEAERLEREKRERIEQERLRKEQEELQRLEQARQKIKEEELLEKYLSSPVTEEAARRFANIYWDEVKKLRRDVYTKNLQVNLSVFGLQDERLVHSGVYWAGEVLMKENGEIENIRSVHLPNGGWHERGEDGGYNTNRKIGWAILIHFQRENLQPIKDNMNMRMFVKAISMRAKEFIAIHYSTDPSGTSYKIDLIEKQGNYRHLKEAFQVNYDGAIYAVEFQYKARNASYQPPREW